MKTRFLVLTSIVLFFVFTGCEKATNNDLKNDQHTLSLKLINEVKQLPSQSDQSLAYGLLSPAEKSMLWKQKLANNLKADTLNELQRKHIEKLIFFIKASIFENTNDKDIETLAFAKAWCLEGLEYFTKNEIVKIAFSIGTTNVIKNNPLPVSNSLKSVEPISECNCNSSSVWSCNSCMSTDKCTQKTSCGFLLNSTCNGLCSAPMK